MVEIGFHQISRYKSIIFLYILSTIWAFFRFPINIQKFAVKNVAFSCCRVCCCGSSKWGKIIPDLILELVFCDISFIICSENYEIFEKLNSTNMELMLSNKWYLSELPFTQISFKNNWSTEINSIYFLNYNVVIFH